MRFRTSLLILCLILASTALLAQQTGSISGRVTSDSQALPGVTVEARSNVLPQPRTSVTDANGEYRLPALQPGTYTLTFTLSGLQTATRRAEVILGQTTSADVKMGVAGVSESITVTAESTLVDRESTAIQSGLNSQQIQALPITQEYRDLMKLIPGVMYSQDTVRGPSAGASGQDNVYLFDGVNVTMPLFGVLVAEPANHDIAQVNIVKGGAKAVDFDRAGGFQIDSVSKSGANKFFGEVNYQVLNHGFIANQKGTVDARFEQDRDWTTLNLGGPILQDQLFFYGSYYRPYYTQASQTNLYGSLPSYKDNRNEGFGKLTYTPTSSILLNGSYRDSHHTQTGSQFSSTQTGTTGTGFVTDLKIGTLEGSWITSPKSFATMKFTDFRNPGTGRADHLASTNVSTALGTQLDINNLDQLGLFTVPTVIATNPTQAAFVQPYIDKYGYVQNGVSTGGGLAGFGRYSSNDDSFFRKNGQVGFNYTLGTAITHDLHFGYQQYNDAEDLSRASNGWGLLTIPGGSINCSASVCGGTAKPVFFQAVVAQQGLGLVPVIHSEYHSQNIELNDSLHWSNWSFNAGVMASNDTLYGQGLAPADNIAGFVKSPGTKYKMHNTPFKDMIQPRLGTTWAYNGSDTLYASYARYNPAANSDARAASWDRNLAADINVYFDQTGKLIGVDPVASSSGKLFVPGIKPRETNEFLIGTAQQLTNSWSARVYTRYRKSDRFWEDTNNNARVIFSPPPGIPQQLYIPNLGTNPTASNPAGTGLRGAIGSGSSYVIAELDGAFTKYYEASLESEWRGRNMTLNGSYTWSHYYGNFDQDNTSFNTGNDASLFIGSSNIGDGAGRQLWNYKYGDLRGDRRNVFKVYGTYNLPWRATTGAFFVYQSGQPYQLESYLPYTNLTSSTSDTNRYAEPAGRRTTPAHYQVDMNYTQNIPLVRGFNLQLKGDVFNLLNKQTGYDYESRIGTLGACNTSNCIATGIAAQPSVNAPFPKNFYDPRRFQLSAGLQF